MSPPPATAAAAPAVRPGRTARPARKAPARKAPAPRRVSGPAKGRAASKGTVRATPRGGAVALPAPGGIALGLSQALAGISSNRWLDRLIRGRAWIALVAFALIGIVAMQLWVVKLGVGIGRALEHEGLLQRENAALSIEDAKLSSGERVEQLAAARGMVVAPPGALRFDATRGALDARLAVAALARGGQVQTSTTFTGAADTASTGETNTGTAAGEAPAAAASSVGTPAESSTEGTTATGASATTATPASASETPQSEAAAPGAATTEGATAESTPAPSTGGGASASSGESTAAPNSTAVGADGGTQQPAPGG
ncbi:MAG TPA: hypothetical protein VGL57_09035 [Solirubrobacteraceae bacterium]|jgi:hypothetical protein